MPVTQPWNKARPQNDTSHLFIATCPFTFTLAAGETIRFGFFNFTEEFYVDALSGDDDTPTLNVGPNLAAVTTPIGSVGDAISGLSSAFIARVDKPVFTRAQWPSLYINNPGDEPVVLRGYAVLGDTPVPDDFGDVSEENGFDFAGSIADVTVVTPE